MAGNVRVLMSLGVAVAVLGVVPFVLMSVSADVEGTLTGRGDRFGPFTLEPDRCRSGQTLGFFGVEIGSSAAQEHKIRLIRDPVEGPMVAYERAGQSGPPAVLRSQDCRKLEIEVIKTNNMVNSVYVVRGSASIDCDELVGSLTFDGCS